jgi:hypothetical protein
MRWSIATVFRLLSTILSPEIAELVSENTAGSVRKMTQLHMQL